MNIRLKSVAIAAAVCALSACGTVNTSVRNEIVRQQKQKRPAVEKPMTIAPQSRVTEVRGNLMPVTAITAPHKGEWLRALRVQLDIRYATPLSAIVAKLADQGVNVASDLRLDSYTYVGKVNATDGETALRAILGSVGLDYQLDDARRLVVIKPMASKSWYLNIGNRKSTYATDGQSETPGAGMAGNSGMAGSTGASSGAGMTGTMPSAMGATTTPGATGTGSMGGTPGQTGTAGTGQSTGTGVASTDDFWTSLSRELTNRLAVMTPRGTGMAGVGGAAMAPLPGGGAPGAVVPPGGPLPPTFQAGAAGGAPGADAELYVKHQIGTFSLNPETGAITVQAPHWVLADLDEYLARVQEMYNTDISFMGEVVLVTSDRSDSEGFDVSAFTKWAGGRFGAVVSNNALGGITMSLPGSGLGSTALVQAGAQAVAGPLVGVTYATAKNALEIFNAYLSEVGNVSVIQRPLVTTTSGIPGVFSKKFVDYYNTVSQQAASGGTGSAATATQNVLVPVELGTELRINPRIDISSGLIRAQLTLNQAIKSGVRNIPQTITFGNNSETVTTAIPLITKQNVSGEVLLRDGDLIVVGGQTDDTGSIDENGLPGKDGPLGGLLGVKKANRGAQTYYFALRVAVNKRK